MRELSGEMLDRYVHPQAGREAALVASSPIDSRHLAQPSRLETPEPRFPQNTRLMA